jgi:radical SAM protein (TIGR01212 family)
MGIERLRRRYGADRFVAYFQPGTNTYGRIERLRELWESAISHPSVVGLIVGTRPDCVGTEVLDLLATIGQRSWVAVEYGLQTIHDRSLDWMNRGHRLDAFLDAVARTRDRGLHVGVHIILGIPGETCQDMLATADELARLRIHSVKIHNLYVAKDTKLEQLFNAGQLPLATEAEYVDYVVRFLERLPGHCAIDRLSSDCPADYLVAPQWATEKARVRRAVEAELERRDTWQGKRFRLSPKALPGKPR